MNFSTDKYQIGTVTTAVPLNETGYPVALVIKLDNLQKAGEDIFDTCKADGGDIRVTDSTGTHEYPVHIAAIDVVAKTGIIWFNPSWPPIPDGHTPEEDGLNNGDSVRVYFNGIDSMRLPGPPYLSSQYVFRGYNGSFDSVYHFENNAVSSTNQLNGTPTNITYDIVDGPIMKGSAIFNGTDSKITNGMSPANASVSLQGHFKINNYPATGERAMLVSKTDYDWKHGDGASRYCINMAVFIDSDGKIGGMWNQNTSWTPDVVEVSSTVLNKNQWYMFHCNFTWYGRSYLYLNKVKEIDVSTNFNMSYLGYCHTTPWTIGKASREFASKIGKTTFDGKMAEVMMTTGPSASHHTVTTTYENQTDLDGFWTWSNVMNGTAIQDDSNILYWQNF